MLSDAAAQITDTWAYDAWGELTSRTGAMENDYLYVVERNVSLAHAMLAHALIGFYERRKEDPFVGSLIERTKALIQEAQRALDEELIDGH